jgi:WD40 repeat protein
LWDTRTWQAVRDIEGPYERGLAAGGARSIAFSPDSKSLAVLYDEVVWPETLTIPTREDIANWNKKETAARKDGTFLEKQAKGELRSFLRTIMAFNVETKKRVFVQTSMRWTPERNGWFTGNLTYTPDGQRLLTLREEHIKLKQGEQGRIRTFIEFRDPLTGTIIEEIERVHVMEISAVAVSPDGRLAATGTTTFNKDTRLNEYTKQWDFIDNKDPVRLWDLATGKKVVEYGPLRGAVKALVFSPDGKLLISCQTDLENKETVWIWDVASGVLIERVRTPRSGTEIFGCTVSPNGRTVAIPVVEKIYLISLQP